MTQNAHDLQRARATRATGWLGLACLAALTAVTVVGCSSTAEPTAVQATSAPAVTVTVTPQPAAPAASVAPAAPPTVTVTAAPAPAPVTTVIAPAPVTTVIAQPDGPAGFRSPSGNINCTLSTSGGENEARCEVVEHTWTVPPPPNCHLDSGDRFGMRQGGPAVVGCYGQEFPPAQQTLGYGQALSLGTLTCLSEYTGMTCTDSSTGHYFRVSRDTYELG
jgi:hypothetical protein